MADVNYNVKITLDETELSTERKEATSKLPKTREDTFQEKARPYVQGALAIYGTYKIGANFIQTQDFNQASVRGDTLHAIKKRQQSQQINEVVGAGVRITAGLLIKGVKGGAVMLALTAFQLANKALQIGLDNARRQQEVRQERYLASIEQERFVRNATTEKIKW